MVFDAAIDYSLFGLKFATVANNTKNEPCGSSWYQTIQ